MTGDMPVEEFRSCGHALIEWISGYLTDAHYPILSPYQPGELLRQLPIAGPVQGTPMEKIIGDFERVILPAVTHWNHPGFFAYLSRSPAAPGILGELLIAALDVNAMMWKFCPAATELEQVTAGWVLDWLGLPRDWFGMLVDSASNSVLGVIVAARQRAESGRLVAYLSEQTNFSLDKALMAAGIERRHVRHIAVDSEFRMRADLLARAIADDQAQGLTPFFVVGTVRTTSSGNITIAPYDSLDQGGVRVFFFPRDSAGARTLARASHAALERYADWFGPLGQESRLTVIEIPDGWGSQASLTAGIIQTADAFRDGAERYQLYHELSHLWNAPDLERPSPRWNEGLASFLQWRMAEELDGWHDWDARIDRIVESLKRQCSAERRCATVPFVEYGSAGLTDLSYSVGALMFDTLYRSLGPQAFDRAYRDFFQRHRLSGGTNRERVASFERVNPGSRRIFADWLYSTRWYQRTVTMRDRGSSLH